jgi:hypothetical protein
MKMPLTYDFLAVLIQSEMARLREGAPGPLHVGWYPNPEEGLWTPAQAQCFNNLLRPMLQLIGAVENQVALETGRNMGEGENVCSYDAIVQAYHRGEPIPKLSAPDELRQSVREEIAAFGQKPVTITLREAAYHPFRNSNLPEWIKVKHGPRSL